MSVAVDAMGGDRGPDVLIKGAIDAARDYDVGITLVGMEDVLRDKLQQQGGGDLPIGIHPASQVVDMEESPADSLRHKKDSSIRVAFELVRQGKAEALVSAGNSGATLATAMVALGRINGVRPAIATLMPTLKKPVAMIDVGANVDCKPVHLLQFGIMGSVFAGELLDNSRPRVGLLSIGEEDTKGNQLVKRAYDLLADSDLNFVGNIEGGEVFKGDVDVIVCDGFVGNICLKLSEGLAKTVLTMLSSEIGENLMAEMGYPLRSAFKRFYKIIDYAEYGGAPLLGINGIAIICHGLSGSKAVKNAIRLAHELAEIKLADKLDNFLSIRQKLFKEVR
ncbi:MAG: phosphate acyltransferase PlsX [Dissulfuribacterales bacterium]